MIVCVGLRRSSCRSGREWRRHWCHACLCGVPMMAEGMSWPATLADDELADDSHTTLAIAGGWE